MKIVYPNNLFVVFLNVSNLKALNVAPVRSSGEVVVGYQEWRCWKLVFLTFLF